MGHRATLESCWAGCLLSWTAGQRRIETVQSLQMYPGTSSLFLPLPGLCVDSSGKWRSPYPDLCCVLNPIQLFSDATEWQPPWCLSGRMKFLAEHLAGPPSLLPRAPPSLSRSSLLVLPVSIATLPESGSCQRSFDTVSWVENSKGGGGRTGNSGCLVGSSKMILEKP